MMIKMNYANTLLRGTSGIYNEPNRNCGGVNTSAVITNSPEREADTTTTCLHILQYTSGKGLHKLSSSSPKENNNIWLNST